MAWLDGFLVDDDIVYELSKYSWARNAKGYGYCYIDKVQVRMHRYIMQAPEGSIVDHINGKVWDNRRENLRFANPSESSCNTSSRKGTLSKYKGVSKELRRIKSKKGDIYEYDAWVATVHKDKKRVFRQRFKTEIEAALAYDRMARIHHGEFAKLNFPE